MTEHSVCKGCKWNNYPTCAGTIMWDGLEMNIENLTPNFQCGRKGKDYVKDFSIEEKSELELKIEEIESRLRDLEL